MHAHAEALGAPLRSLLHHRHRVLRHARVLLLLLLRARLPDALAQLVAGVALLVLARANVGEEHLLHLQVPRIGAQGTIALQARVRERERL